MLDCLLTWPSFLRLHCLFFRKVDITSIAIYCSYICVFLAGLLTLATGKPTSRFVELDGV